MKTLKLIVISIFLSFTNLLCGSGTVYTPNGSAIITTTGLLLTSAQIEDIRTMMQNEYPSATIITLNSECGLYNCHSYAWNVSEGGPKIWINQGSNNLSKYWTDLSYVNTTEDQAEKIFYYAADHSAVKSSVSGKYLSKWGYGALVLHYPTDCPYNPQRNYYKSYDILGNDIIECSSTAVYSINRTSYTAIWSVSGGLEIISGQGTNSITVHSVVSSNIPDALITAVITLADGSTKTLTKVIYIGAPVVTSITGPSSLRVNQGGSFYANCTPDVTMGTYQWLVQPSTYASQSPNNNTNYISFSYPGYYTVNCRAVSPCGTAGTYASTSVYVSASGSYSISANATTHIVTLSPTAGLNLNAAPLASRSSDMNYEVFNQATGVRAASGVMSRNGATLNFSSLPSGIYVIRVEVAQGAYDSLKFVLR